MKSLLPWVGDRKAQEAWDDVFGRDMLGAVVLGGSTGKFIEYVIQLLVVLFVGADASPLFETFAYLIGWAVAIPVGVYVFVRWHEIGDEVQEKVEEATEEAAEKVEEATDE